MLLAMTASHMSTGAHDCQFGSQCMLLAMTASHMSTGAVWLMDSSGFYDFLIGWEMILIHPNLFITLLLESKPNPICVITKVRCIVI